MRTPESGRVGVELALCVSWRGNLVRVPDGEVSDFGHQPQVVVQPNRRPDGDEAEDLFQHPLEHRPQTHFDNAGKPAAQAVLRRRDDQARADNSAVVAVRLLLTPHFEYGTEPV